jgi:hypothetical protein
VIFLTVGLGPRAGQYLPVEASSMGEAVRECDLLMVATGWPDYKAIDPAWCKRSDGPRLTVLDLWRTLRRTSSPTLGIRPA